MSKYTTEFSYMTREQLCEELSVLRSRFMQEVSQEVVAQLRTCSREMKDLRKQVKENFEKYALQRLKETREFYRSSGRFRLWKLDLPWWGEETVNVLTEGEPKELVKALCQLEEVLQETKGSKDA